VVQFLMEAVTLSAIGGMIGIAFGMLVSLLIAYFGNTPSVTPAVWIVAAFASSALIGIGFGFYPAWKASQLDPIDALRYE
jgi:ABC-type antimicrobial peptide transport system permease subunit